MADTPLPPSTEFTGASVTEGGFKTAITNMRQFLADLLGTSGSGINISARPINEAKAADIASAATVNLDAATGNLVHITGTTTITAITLASGAERTVVFDGALTLTHNATTLILPGGANITTAAGDRAIFRGDGSGNTRCITYTRANGTPLAGNVLPGTVIWFGASSAPTGYLKANGAAVSRTTYASLFAAIGTTFGTGDGSTTFNVPDLRGEFIRGWDDSRGVDSGRSFGSAQAANLAAHAHAINTYNALNTNSPAVVKAMSVEGTQANIDTGSTGTGSDTRPRNVALLACIKY